MWLEDLGHTGEPIDIEGEPVEVATGRGFLWIATTADDAIVKIPVPEPPAGL